MNKYEKPILNIIELQVDEFVAALVPKTVYRKNPGTTSFNRTTTASSEIAELESYATSNQTS